MEFSEGTTNLLQRLELHAQKSLAHRNEVGMLIEIAQQQNGKRTLDELSFFAKSAHKTYGIMKRIGSNAEGYDKLSNEFGESVAKSKQMIEHLISHAPEDEKMEFTERFLTVSPAAFGHLLSLLSDLSLYKNYLIDSRAG